MRPIEIIELEKVGEIGGSIENLDEMMTDR